MLPHGSQNVVHTWIIRRSLAVWRITLSHSRKCLVCSTLKLCREFWSLPPFLGREGVKLIKVQRMVARMSEGTEQLTLSYGERLHRTIPLNLEKRPGKDRERLLVCDASWNHE